MTPIPLASSDVQEAEVEVLIFVTFSFQGPKLEPVKEDALASAYKSVSHSPFRGVVSNVQDEPFTFLSL